MLDIFIKILIGISAFFLVGVIELVVIVGLHHWRKYWSEKE